DLPKRTGFNTMLNFAETSGNYRFSLGGRYVSDEYDPNDLGINFYTDYHQAWATASYRILNPTKTFNTFNITAEFNSEFDNVTGRPQDATLYVNANSTTLKNDYFGTGFSIKPGETFDF